MARASPKINHLLFADDTMFFTKTTPTSVNALKEVLTKYEAASGQMINTAKSSITFSNKTPIDIRERVKASLGISKEGRVGKYLGLPEHFGRRKKNLFTSIVDRIHQKAASMSTRQLSAGGGGVKYVKNGSFGYAITFHDVFQAAKESYKEDSICIHEISVGYESREEEDVLGIMGEIDSIKS